MNNSNYKLVIKDNEGETVEEKSVTITEAIELFSKQQIKLCDLIIKENDKNGN